MKNVLYAGLVLFQAYIPEKVTQIETVQTQITIYNWKPHPS
jgi:hypothetical protein